MAELAEKMHLAELIEEELFERMIQAMGPFDSERDEEICRYSWQMFFTVREPNVLLGETMAAQLEKALGINYEFFLKFHENWRKAESLSDQHEMYKPKAIQ